MEKNLDIKIKAMASRIKELREIENLSVSQMAEFTGVTEEEYAACERGERDLNFAFIYRTANALHVNVTDIIEGTSPLLSSYTVTRSGKGQRVANAHGMTYYNLAAAFQNRIAEPLYVRVKYVEGAEEKEIECTTHAGQPDNSAMRINRATPSASTACGRVTGCAVGSMCPFAFSSAIRACRTS